MVTPVSGARPNCSATQISVTFMRLARQIPGEEEDNSGTGRHLPDKPSVVSSALHWCTLHYIIPKDS